MVNHLNVLSLILILISISAKKLLDWHSCEGDILSIDTAALTGEPLPRKYPSEECLSCRGVKFEDRERMGGWMWWTQGNAVYCNCLLESRYISSILPSSLCIRSQTWSSNASPPPSQWLASKTFCWFLEINQSFPLRYHILTGLSHRWATEGMESWSCPAPRWSLGRRTVSCVSQARPAAKRSQRSHTRGERYHIHA